LAATAIASELYPGIEPGNLTNEQKANISALSTLAAGLAGGVAGDSSYEAGAGVEGGKLVTDIAGLLAGGAGMLKGGAVLTEKVVAKVAGKAESAVVDAGKTAGTTEAISSGKLSGPAENWKNYTYAETVAQTTATGRLVNADKAVIDPNKVTSYALNTEHPTGGNKAKVFESALGYNQSNAADLIAKVQEGVKMNPVKMGSSDKFGQRMTIDMPITGPNGNTVVVRTGWIYDVVSTTPRLTTIYVNK